MRKPPKLYRPQPDEELGAGLRLFAASIEAAMLWMHEAVEKIEAAQQPSDPAEGCRYVLPNGTLCMMDLTQHQHEQHVRDAFANAIVKAHARYVETHGDQKPNTGRPYLEPFLPKVTPRD